LSKRILVTGAAGFIYSSFTRYALENRDWTVVTLDRLDEAGTLQRLSATLEDYRGRLRHVWHDLRAPLNPQHFSALLSQPFDYIVHGAACSHVNRATLRPLEAAYDNVIGTVNMLDYARDYQPQAKFLYVSTDEIFGPAPEGIEFGEHARWEPENPYASAKAAGEAFCPAYAHQYGMKVCVTRCANVYGPAQYREKFIPLCVEKVLRGEVVQIHARDGVSSSRLYIHVDDVAEATLTVLEKGGVIAGPTSGRYNIVPSREWSNLIVAEMIADLLGRPLKYELVSNPPGRPKPDQRYAIRGDKLLGLGWAPIVSFETGLADTVKSLAAEFEKAA
jgi:dTDP-glucose 4,6-dehydratase